MSSDRAGELVVLRFGDRTPCCSAVPRVFDRERVVCRLCGTVYRNVSVLVRDAFPGALDVTPLTPARYLRGGDHA